MDQKTPCVYILTNKPNGVLYIGVTTNLVQRTWQHRQKLVTGFSNKYNLQRLVWYERHESIDIAISREKQMKKWNRDWKIQLIETSNPGWQDLYDEIL
jgi:putative endonuclease